MSFYAIGTLLINLVGDYLFQIRIASETTVARDLAVEFAPMFDRGNAGTLFLEADQAARDLGGRLLIMDMDGKVQIDTSSEFNGWRIAHSEVISVLNGAESDYGFHLLKGSHEREQRALFDFLREKEVDGRWVGYFSQALIANSTDPIGIVLYSVSVQDMVDSLRVIQDQMVLVFFVAALAVFVMSFLFSRIITQPIAALSEGIKRMAQGDLSTRVKVSGSDEFARLGDTFNQMSEKLELVDESRNEFVSNASHELKTPLATMKIMLESIMYQEDMPKELQAEFMGDINAELNRMSNIVSDLLTLVQADAREYRINRRNLLLSEAVEKTLRRLRPLAQEKNMTISLHGTSALTVFADPVKIDQIVYNLVENAIKYSPVGGKVRLVVKQEGRSAVLEISDTGPGIPKADQPHIFDRFYRVDRARARETGGNGLGLAIVHQAVMLHNGSVSVRSQEGKGATFRVELPISSS